MWKRRTPPLNQLATVVFSRCADVALGKFGCRLCAPNRPPALHHLPSSPCSGAVSMITGFDSDRMSASQTSFGASAQLSLVDSSETSATFRPKIGCHVWVQAVNGGEKTAWPTTP